MFELSKNGRGAAVGAFVVSIACGGGGAGTVTAPSTLPPPTVAITAIPDRSALIAGFTVATFRAAGSAAPGSEYSWSFGDGTRATGAEVTHVFANSGAFHVTAAVRDANTSATASTALDVIVGSLEGRWSAQRSRWVFQLSRSGELIGGGVLGQVGNFYSAPYALAGTATQPNTLSFAVEAFAVGFTGVPSRDFLTLQGTFTNGPNSGPEVLVRE